MGYAYCGEPEELAGADGGGYPGGSCPCGLKGAPFIGY